MKEHCSFRIHRDLLEALDTLLASGKAPVATRTEAVEKALAMFLEAHPVDVLVYHNALFTYRLLEDLSRKRREDALARLVAEILLEYPEADAEQLIQIRLSGYGYTADEVQRIIELGRRRLPR